MGELGAKRTKLALDNGEGGMELSHDGMVVGKGVLHHGQDLYGDPEVDAALMDDDLEDDTEVLNENMHASVPHGQRGAVRLDGVGVAVGDAQALLANTEGLESDTEMEHSGVSLWQGEKLAGSPGDEEIVATARSSCCIERLMEVLQAKYAELQADIPVRVAHLLNNSEIALSLACAEGKHGMRHTLIILGRHHGGRLVEAELADEGARRTMAAAEAAQSGNEWMEAGDVVGSQQHVDYGTSAAPLPESHRAEAEAWLHAGHGNGAMPEWGVPGVEAKGGEGYYGALLDQHEEVSQQAMAMESGQGGVRDAEVAGGNGDGGSLAPDFWK